VGKYSLFAEVFDSLFNLATICASILLLHLGVVCFVTLMNTFSVPPHSAACFVSILAITLPNVPAWALTQENFILQCLLSRLSSCSCM